jgi:hypothetical protein
MSRTKIHYFDAPNDTESYGHPDVEIDEDIRNVTCKRCLKWAAGIRKDHRFGLNPFSGDGEIDSFNINEARRKLWIKPLSSKEIIEKRTA